MASAPRRMTRWDLPRMSSPSLSSPNPALVLDAYGTALSPAILASMTVEQKEFYASHFRVQEITMKLRLPDKALQSRLPPRRPREVSPPPEYNSATGIRTNTRVRRHRRALEMERHDLVARLADSVPSYQVPAGYCRPCANTRFSDRLFIPQDEHPHVKFIGQILGPRGRDLQKLQDKADGANIVIRGKGSVKEGKAMAVRKAQRPGVSDGSTSNTNIINNNNNNNNNSDNLPLHVLISADSQDKVDKARRLVQQVIDDAVAKPDWQNERKQQQLRGVAEANGTLRDDERLLGYGGVGVRRAWGLTFLSGTTLSGASSDDVDTMSTAHAAAWLAQNARSTPDNNQEEEEEIRRIMQDIEGGEPISIDERANAAQQGNGFRTLPPWRIDRLRRQGASNI